MQGNDLPDVRRWDYLDFELEIGSGSGGEYPVTVLRSPAGEAREIMHFPFGDLELENQLLTLRNALLSPGKKLRRVLSQEQQAVQDFGQTLFEALLVGEIRSRYDVSQQAAREEDKGLRLKLRIQPPKLAVLPWEYLYDSRRGEYVCLSRHTPLVRYLELPHPILPLIVTPPLRILGMAVCPSDLPPLDLAREKKWMEDAVQALQEKGLVTLSWLPGQTWDDLQQAMQRGPWHVFHFIGHGEFDRDADEGFIALADELGKAYLLSATELGRLLADHRSLRLALLNACEGARGGRQDIFSSTAAILMRLGIPAVLAMQYPVTDQAAIGFARYFYRFLADGLPVDTAATEARKAISLAVRNTPEWGTPALYMRSPDGVLFHIQDRAKTDGVQEGTKPEVSHEAQQVSAEGTKEAPEQKVTEAPPVPPGAEEVHEVPSGSQDVPSEQLEGLHDRGMRYLQSQSWKRAVESFGELVRIAPWYKGAGQIYLEAKDRAREAEEFERKKVHKSEYTEDLYSMGKTCYERAQWESAAYYLGRIVESGEEYNDTVVLLKEANKQLRLRILRTEVAACFRESKWTKVTEALEAILSIDPTDEEARAQLDQAREQHRLQTVYERAMDHFRGERWDQAIADLKKIPRETLYYLDAAARLEEARKQQRLARVYRDALWAQERSQWEEAISKFTYIIRQAGVYKEAAERLAKVQKQQELVELLKQGDHCMRQRKWREAIQEFEKAFAIDPSHQGIQTGLKEARTQLHLEQLRERGEAGLRAENWQQAVEIFGELHRLDPMDTNVTAKLEKAKRQLELRRLYDEAMGYFHRGKWRPALVALEKVVSLDPDYREAAANLEIVREHLRQGNPAIKALRDPVMQGIGVLVAIIALIVTVYPFAKDAFVNRATPTPKPPTLCNGTFDDKFECWERGGKLESSVKCEGSQCYAVLGSSDYKCEGKVPVEEAWIRQSFQVPQTISPTLSLRYRIFSQDVYANDSFRVQINEDVVEEFGNHMRSMPACDGEPWDSEWQTFGFDLSGYRGQDVEVLLSNVNGKYQWWNTWTYVDDVQVHETPVSSP